MLTPLLPHENRTLNVYPQCNGPPTYVIVVHFFLLIGDRIPLIEGCVKCFLFYHPLLAFITLDTGEAGWDGSTLKILTWSALLHMPESVHILSREEFVRFRWGLSS